MCKCDRLIVGLKRKLELFVRSSRVMIAMMFTATGDWSSKSVSAMFRYTP